MTRPRKPTPVAVALITQPLVLPPTELHRDGLRWTMESTFSCHTCAKAVSLYVAFWAPPQGAVTVSGFRCACGASYEIEIQPQARPGIT